MCLLLIIVSYYILLIIPKRRSKAHKKFSSISIIIPAHNEEEYIEECINSVLEADFLGKKQIIVVDDGSRDRTSEIVKKFDEGPVAYMTVLPKGMPSMGKNMVISFIFYLVVGIFVAYLASRFLSIGTEYLTVFRLTGTVAFVAYGMGIIPDAIWFGRPWTTTFKHLFDALVYSLLTAGTFGWLWPN